MINLLCVHVMVSGMMVMVMWVMVVVVVVARVDVVGLELLVLSSIVVALAREDLVQNSSLRRHIGKVTGTLDVHGGIGAGCESVMMHPWRALVEVVGHRFHGERAILNFPQFSREVTTLHLLFLHLSLKSKITR